MKMAVVFWHVKIHMALIHVESMGQQETEERHYEVVYSPKDTSPPRVILQYCQKKQRNRHQGSNTGIRIR